MSPAPARQTTRPPQTGSARAHLALAVAAALCWVACQGTSGSRTQAPRAPDPAAALPPVTAAPPIALAPGEEIELFDGSTLGMWEPEVAGSDSQVSVAEGAIQLGWGNPGTGLTWTGTRIPESYELALEVRRVEGSGSGYWFLSFPIDGERTCTLTLATGMAWLCDASGPVGDGALTNSAGLNPEGWHAVRVTVARGRVEASVDGESLAVQPTASAPVALADAPASEPSLGISTWAMTAAVRDIRLKRLP